MNPHADQPTSLVSLAQSVFRHRELIVQMTKRDVVGRYRGSVIGLLWSFLTPVLMLTVYTFVFSVVMKAKWNVGVEESKAQFAVVLFVGLIVHNLFSDVINRAPGVILGNVNYVKKVVFPLEILPIVSMGASLFHSMVSLGVLLAAFVLLNGFLHWTLIFAPIVIAPLILLTLGVAWLLASIGVYLRDVGQTTGILTTAMLFLSPVFYPLSALPEQYQTLLHLNPLTFIIEQSRRVLLFGQLPNWTGLLLYAAVSLTIAWIGYWWFQRTRKGFADVL